MKVVESGLFLPETDSTNSHLRRLLERGEEVPRYLAAARQTSGRGRCGKRFYSPEGGLYVTFCLKRQEVPRPDLLTPTAALAVREALRCRYGAVCGVKWVNDLYREGKKICGILTEAVGDCYLTGIGVNLKEPPSVPGDLSEIYGALNVEEKDPEGLARKILAELLSLKDAPRQEIVRRYREAMFLTGRTISFTQNGEEYSGLCLGTDEDLRLLVRTAEGIRSLSSGEVSLRLTRSEP